MKAILEMEVPESCYGCPLIYWNPLKDIHYCFYAKKSVEGCQDGRSSICLIKIVEDNKEVKNGMCI